MEAARVAATRGHEVTLIERGPSLGGMVRTLALNPLTADIGNVVEYLATQMGKLGVDVRICREATGEDVRAIAPDVLIVAAGSDALIPEAAAGEPGVMTLREASENRRAIGQRVVVWGLFGAEMAITLAEEGREVTLMGRGGEGSLGSDVANARRWWLLRKLTDANVPRGTPAAQRLTNPTVLYNAEVEEIKSGEIHARVEGNRQGRRVIPYDTLVVCQRFGERRANDALFDELQSAVPEVFKIGDCSQIRGIKEAIWSANEVARGI
jgi:heterodisulfide reductase subunit A-like polyferredoxin